ncbi:MAG: S9 family peptidase [Proteobacteria bacterium]|nr:S9 family peptidase [Pseudomonadota bacterium]
MGGRRAWTVAAVLALAAWPAAAQDASSPPSVPASSPASPTAGTPATAPPAAAAPRAALPPAPRVDTFVRSLHGELLDDPFRWLEDLSGSEARAWLAAQDRYAEATLSALPGRAALHDDLVALAAGAVDVAAAQSAGGRIFYLERDARHPSAALVMREGNDGAERVLVEPTSHQAVAFFRASPNGRRVAYGLVARGDADPVLRVIDVDSGRELGPARPRAALGEPLAWRIDSNALFYAQRSVPSGTGLWRGETLTMREFLFDGRVVERALTGVTSGNGNDTLPDFGTRGNVRLATGASSWALVTSRRGHANDLIVHAAALTDLRTSHPRWQPIAEGAAGIEAVAVRGDFVYALTHAGAPRGRIVRWSLSDDAPYALDQAEVVLPESAQLLTGLAAARDALYVAGLDHDVATLTRLEYNVKLRRPPRARNGTPAALPKVAGIARATRLKLPAADALTALATDPLRDGALFALEGWTQSRTWFAVDGKGNLAAMPWSAPPSAALREAVVTRIDVAARDGTRIPVTLLANPVHAPDAPLLLHVFGTFGVRQAAEFQPLRAAWLARGGVIAFAHVRGGGELGEDWHQAAVRMDKPRSAQDCVDVAADLAGAGWTRAGRIVLAGRGAGALVAANAARERPALFAALVADGGLYDLLRADGIVRTPIDAAEFGPLDSDVDFALRRQVSPYFQRPPTVGLAALLTADTGDRDVDAWQTAKMAAALATAGNADATPVLLRMGFDGAYSAAPLRPPAVDRAADAWSFALWRTGDPRFAPPPAPAAQTP